MLISPTEPAELRDVGRTSSRPEVVGCDMLFSSPLGIVGIQRKTITDLIASAQGDRLYRSRIDMSGKVDIPIMVVEGRPRWSVDGELMGIHTQWDKDQWFGLLLTIQLAGWWIVYTADLEETKQWLIHAEKWMRKSKHTSILTRPKARGERQPWGGRRKASREDVVAHFWQSFPGIGEDTARSLARTVGLPLQLTVTPAELSKVKGMGRGRVAMVCEFLVGTPEREVG
jgi:ERCC4-type nuclease